MKQMLCTLGAVLGLAGTALPLVPGTAHAMEGLSIEMGAKAQFLNGALIGIPIVYTCPKGSTSPSVFVQLYQASGSEVVNGSAFEDALVCDGGPKETLILVVPNGSSPFRRSKDVVVDVNVSACDELTATCGNTSAGPALLSLKR
ncbi:hypothetical protein [Polyangium sp. y55x31]|uniref:hypothetical protein n=1 Tax=Polyangium sp. y55x31 TaxID=3042688 RepID=UPI00248223D6|nr:hypothetical protein [Polyangium sp. y55x31]MDI1475929.1 hypothetical protein [Polyangium sp. y55x31]